MENKAGGSSGYMKREFSGASVPGTITFHAYLRVWGSISQWDLWIYEESIYWSGASVRGTSTFHAYLRVWGGSGKPVIAGNSRRVLFGNCGVDDQKMT